MLIEELEHKKILVLGLGREGVSSFQFLRRRFPEKVIGLADKLSKNQLDEPTRRIVENDKRVILISGNDYLKNISQFDIICKSSGIKPSIPELDDAKDKGIKTTSNTGLFFECCSSTIIGVTGTKGKSTTATLIYEILKLGGIDVRLTGNIGTPPLSSLEGTTSSTVFIVELSSYQLKDLHKSPHIAVILNITPEHIDFHGTFAAYVEAKRSIVQHQHENDFIIFNSSDKISTEIANISKAKKLSFGFQETIHTSCFMENNFLLFHSKEQREKIVSTKSIHLKGSFNLQNVMPGIIVGKLFNIPDNNIATAIQNFRPLEHRLEYVETCNGISFYNDSLATVPEATIAALSVFSERGLILLVGGFDRGLDLTGLARIIIESRIKGLILFPTTGNRLWDNIVEIANVRGNLPKHCYSENMREAVQKAYNMASEGDTILLSPASASFNLFTDYKDRGNQFKDEVKNLFKEELRNTK
ncbi:UDP-N-acetylmuramoylalanine-D-glutamate ligase [Candidatus Scalindua japonica]|uniref:UDP-N-acetylmuramoylalanine--D-glutamate ligase n=1 Tax=Candidatus Scalindua japonica TaxID=1284222 RepID=A0A286U2I0_9BACT|nr:UDP-N-acetylmuramoyl-L-alanine--D-glutamate ligase [Candidatus Scalindua japonica]GAX62336.1 UDP-N-acetylmuramoylalanine-D-glutamate ligase [Candidatus Scalindua japonica]